MEKVQIYLCQKAENCCNEYYVVMVTESMSKYSIKHELPVVHVICHGSGYAFV